MRASRQVSTEAPSTPLCDLLEADLGPEALAGLAEGAGGVPLELWERALLDPAREILGRPGKEFRGRLVDLAWRLGGGAGAPPPALAAMLEIIHAGSMVIDDVEDDSTERRGGPCVHRIHGVPLAINVGNWLYFWPFQILERLALPPARELELRRRMTRTMFDCHFGQALDLGARVGGVARTRLPEVVATITALKTARLVELAASAGALAAGAPDGTVAALGRFGQGLGVGLQMLDDLGNLSGKAAPAKRHEDLRLGRATWPWAWAAELSDDESFAALEEEAGLLCARAAEAGARGEAPPSADGLAARLRERCAGHGRLAAHWHLDRALGSLRASVGPTPLLDLLEAEIARLEESYV
jgi:geranylgeranyl pyrophosphate synthase